MSLYIHKTDPEVKMRVHLSAYLTAPSARSTMTSGSLWNYYREEIDNIKNNASDGKSFKYKPKIVEKTPARPGNEGDVNRTAVSTLDVEVFIPLRQFSNFWRFFDLPLINCEMDQM